jgi:hypothetical protein
VGISMWASIDTNLHLALVTYALLAIPAWALWRKGQERNESGAGEGSTPS